MHQDTPTPRGSCARLTRLRALVDDRAIDEYGCREIADLLTSPGRLVARPCPRYAGILLESGDPYVVVADTLDGLAGDIAGHVVGEVPLSPDTAIDLDTGDERDIHLDVRVAFGELRREQAPGHEARPSV